MADIMQNFNTGLDTYITKEQLREICPLAFASEPTNPDVSKKYLFVNTETVIGCRYACKTCKTSSLANVTSTST